MSFKDQSWQARFGAMGDEAEGVFEKVYPEGWARFGLNRPPINLSRVPPKLRYAPDYITAKGLVEVQGFGRDQTAKFKDDKLEALWSWHEDFRCDVFVWDSANKRYGFIRLPDLFAELSSAQRRAFPEGKPYYAFRSTTLPVVEWIDFDPSAA